MVSFKKNYKPYFHVSRELLPLFTPLEVGRYGSINYFQYFEDHTTYVLSEAGKRLNSDSLSQLKKEALFESLRKKEYPSRPSRMDCVYLFEDRKFTTLHIESKRFENDKKIFTYEIEILSGEPFIADAELLDCKGKDAGGVLGDADKYWRGIISEESKMVEVLLKGKAIIQNML